MRHFSTKKLSLVLAALLAALALAAGATKGSGSAEAVSWTDGPSSSALVSWDS